MNGIGLRYLLDLNLQHWAVIDYESTVYVTDLVTGCIQECSLVFSNKPGNAGGNGNSNFITIYPNPSATGRFNLTVDGFENFSKTMEVVNVYGKTILNHEFEGRNASVDLSEYATGVYFIQISDGLTTKTERVIYR